MTSGQSVQIRCYQYYSQNGRYIAVTSSTDEPKVSAYNSEILWLFWQQFELSDNTSLGWIVYLLFVHSKTTHERRKSFTAGSRDVEINFTNFEKLKSKPVRRRANARTASARR